MHPREGLTVVWSHRMVPSLQQVQNHLWPPHRVQSSMTERKPPKSRDDLDKRLRQFRNKRDVATGRDRNTDSTNNGLGFAMRIGVELVAALVIGVGFGLFLDSWLDTKPWFMLGFFLLGAAAGTVQRIPGRPKSGGRGRVPAAGQAGA